jgi:putative RNA 2'-phosphotransferase
MNEQQQKRTGKFISLILRHNPQKIGIKLDLFGWATVDELLAALKRNGHSLSFPQLEELVSSNDKQRYTFNHDKSCIRANQGHSLELDLQLEAQKPPKWLYHGTASRFLPYINEQGLLRRNRHHVHLSLDKETAHNVGSRHGKPVILTIDTSAMHNDGHLFYCSKNGVWLVEHIPPRYFSV